MERRFSSIVGVCCALVCVLMLPAAAMAQGENIGNSEMSILTPDPIPVGPQTLCFTVSVISPDLEYMDRFDIDLPDGWTVDGINIDSVPPAQGCPSALPPVVGTDPGNVVYWQSTGYPPATGCGAWNGGAAGTLFDFCVDVTVDAAGAPWMFNWNIAGDGFGGTPHSAAGSYGPVNVDVMAPPNDLCADATRIICDLPSIDGTTIDATFDGFPTCGTTNTAPGVWYSIIGTGGEITVDTCTGTSYDTKISVYTDGCDPVSTTCVDGNDDFCGLQSSVTWISSPGVEYLILVHGFSSGTGDFTLSINCEAAGPAITLTKTVGTVPAVCAATDAITVSSGTPVYYCYEVENVGDVTFEYHTLDDDILGQQFVDFPQTLPPGGSYQYIVESTVSGSSVTNTGTWTASDVAGGYVVDDQIQVDFVDISGTGTPVGLSDDSTQLLPIGFTFDYYSMPYTNIEVSSNGFLSVNAAGDNGCCTGDPLPDVGTPNGVIAGWWEDLNPTDGGTVHYETMGTSPNQVFIVQFTNIPHFASPAAVTMQYKLFEGSDVIEVHYLLAESDGGTHSAGIENQDGSVGFQYYLGVDPLTTPLAIQYAPAVGQEATAFDTATVNISDPDITVNPASLLSSQLSGEVNVLPLDIGNVGAENLDWNIVEAQPRSIPPSDGNFVRGANPPSFGAAPVGIKPGGWNDPFVELLRPGTFAFATEASNGNHVTFDVDTPETLVNIAPSTGAFWAGDFVGSDLTKTYQINDANQLVTIDAATGAQTVIGTVATPPGGETYTGMTYDASTGNTYATSCNITTSSLFEIDVTTATATLVGPITGSPCSIAVAVDGSGNMYTYDLVNDVLLSIDKTTGAGTTIGSIGFDANFGQGMDFDSATGTMYMSAFNNATFQPELRTVDLTTGNTSFVGVIGATAPGGTVQLGWVGFAFLDSPCMSPSDVPWLSVAPDNGTIAPAGSTQVDVTFDSTGLSTGIYEAVLCVFSNDPDEPLVPVPTTLEVLIPVELLSIEIE